MPKDGPLAWWHKPFLGIGTADPKAGMVASALQSPGGANLFLASARPIGVVLGGQFVADPALGVDVETHGTLIAGVISANPPAGSGWYVGLAPGADTMMIRIDMPTGGGSQADTTATIERLSSTPISSISARGVSADHGISLKEVTG